MKAITYTLSLITLIVVSLNGAGSFDSLKPQKRADERDPWVGKVVAMSDGAVYLFTLGDGVWCRNNGAVSPLSGIAKSDYISDTDMIGDTMYLATSNGAYEVRGCQAKAILLPERWMNP